MNTILSTNTPVYMVKFLNSNEAFIFGSGSETLGNLIQHNGNNGIEYIKQLDGCVFKKMSKIQVESWFSFDTHSIEQLKRINYIK